VKAADFRPETLIDALAPPLGLALTPESRAQVIVHLKIAAQHAENLFSAPADDHEEPAPVFTP
jgi:Protein of unknown function (DUF4089)